MYARLSAAFAKERRTTTAEAGVYYTLGTKSWRFEIMLPTAPQFEVDLPLQYYPKDVTVGYPLDTGFLNMLGRLFLDSILDPS
jgi:hypothetical protein